MKTNYLFTIILFLWLTLFAGCYTVLVHPNVETTDENGYTYSDEVKFYDECSDCHKDIPTGNLSKSEILNAHQSYSNFGYYDFENNYYTDSYYGDYGYYYNYPWWLEVAPAVKYKKSEQYSGGARDNDSERGTTTRERKHEMDIPSPSVSTGSSNTSSSTSSSNNSGNTTETRTSTNSNSDRNSSGTSGTRDNSGGRSSDSGRRK
jgi:hypothetical protein